MKIIDFERKGNVIRLYLGEKTPEWGWTNSEYKAKNGKTPEWLKPSETYYGDDWNDAPYEQNAGKVYNEFIKGYFDIFVDFDDLALEPCSGELNSNYTKEDMVNRVVPCIIVVPKDLVAKVNCDKFTQWIGADGIQKYYFGDEINSPDIVKITY